MENRLFNKIIKREMISYGFEKTGTYDYAKEAVDGITKIVVRAPDQTHGFGIGVQFKDFDKPYTDYSGKVSKICMPYKQQTHLLYDAARFDYSEEVMVNAVRDLMQIIDPFLQRGKDAIRETIDRWVNSTMGEEKQNDIYAYFDLPLIDPYSDAYIQKQMKKYIRGMKSMMPLEEYYSHKEHYDKYAEQGCSIDIGEEFVTISYDEWSVW